MTVSNEGRDAATVELSKHYVNVEDPWRCVCGVRVRSWHEHLVGALIAHGWGPTKAAVIEELQLWLESGRVREQGLVGAWEFEVRIAYLRGEDHPMMPRRKGVTDDRTE